MVIEESKEEKDRLTWLAPWRPHEPFGKITRMNFLYRGRFSLGGCLLSLLLRLANRFRQLQLPEATHVGHGLAGSLTSLGLSLRLDLAFLLTATIVERSEEVFQIGAAQFLAHCKNFVVIETNDYGLRQNFMMTRTVATGLGTASEVQLLHQRPLSHKIEDIEIEASVISAAEAPNKRLVFVEYLFDLFLITVVLSLIGGCRRGC